MKRWLITVLAFTFLTTLSIRSDGDQKRVAVLYFEDHSHFNSPAGCLPSWWIFRWFLGGRPKGKEVWDLEDGFRKMMNEALAKSEVYEPIPPERIEEFCRKMNVKVKDLGEREDLRARLAEELDLDAMITGEVLKFGQERFRGIVGGKSRITGNVLTGVGLRGYFYVATVAIKLHIYDRSGGEISSFKIGKKATHQFGAIGAGPIETVISDMGLETRFGAQPISSKITKKHPIVESEELDRIKFASPQYHKTLFGIATDSALEEAVYRIRQEIGPRPPKKEVKQGLIEGKIMHVSEDGTIFVNVGSDKGVTVGVRFEVLSTIPLIDPDTGEVLGKTTERIGVIEITEVESGRLSKAKAVKGNGFKKGDVIRNLGGNQGFGRDVR